MALSRRGYSRARFGRGSREPPRRGTSLSTVPRGVDDLTGGWIERQTELVLEQMKLCLETAGSSLENVLKCNVYRTSVGKFAAVNAIYARYFPKHPPARIFVNVPAWPGHFDIEIDCIAAVG